MKKLSSVLRAARFACLIIVCWATGLTTALAQGTTESGASSTDYTLAYFLVGFPVILGLLVTLRGSNRRKRDRPEQYVEKNFLGKN
jgi:hypothetical protein